MLLHHHCQLHLPFDSIVMPFHPEIVFSFLQYYSYSRMSCNLLRRLTIFPPYHQLLNSLVISWCDMQTLSIAYLDNNSLLDCLVLTCISISSGSSCNSRSDDRYIIQRPPDRSRSDDAEKSRTPEEKPQTS